VISRFPFLSPRLCDLSAVLLASLASLIDVAGVAAQAPPDSLPADSLRVLGGIVVTVAKPAVTSGGSSSVVIELDSLGAPPAPSMEQVLRSMPLIQIRTNSRGEAQPALRGSEDRQVSILVDGVPLTLGWDHRTDMSIIPLTAAHDVTLVRGLSSVLYGPNTLGGVVAVDVARSQERSRFVHPVSAGISLDQTGATQLSATAGYLADDTDDQWVFRAGAGYQERPGLRVAKGFREDPDLIAAYLADADALRLNSDARRVDGFFTARYRADQGVWGALSLSGYDVERGVPPEAHQADPRFWRYPAQRRVVAALSGGTGYRDTGKGTGDLEFALGLDRGSAVIESYADELYSTVTDTEDSDDFVVTARLLGEHTVGDRANLRASATYADVSHDEILTPGDAAAYRQRLWSLGAETELRLGRQGATGLSIGAALDGADTPEAGDKPAMGRISDYGVRSGITSLLSDGVLVHGSASRRARFPSLREMYSGALGRFEPNPGLRAEALVALEAGFTATGSLGELQLVGFHHRLVDGIVRRSVTGADGVRRFQRVNQDEVRGTGAELLAVVSFGGATLSGDLTLEHVRGLEADGSEVELEYEPAVTGKVVANVRAPAGVWLGGGLRFVGGQKCENPELGGLEPLASSTLMDLSVRRLFGMRSGGALSRVEASAAVQNLADAPVFDQCGLPQPGRVFQVQLRLW
jgi:iron complex outermembrane receptor protein